jgi:DNA sulfur modification protein DndD
MKIKKIQLENFRQFYGQQEILLSTDSKKNVTLIHAENGFGKTTILNAVLWTFFNKTTTKFEQPDKIVNFEAAKEGVTVASVGIEIDFNGETFLVNRRFDSKIERADKTSFNAFKIEKSGSLVSLSVPRTFIDSVMPPEMSTYFFFDGESAESFSSATNFQLIGQAIRNILGVSLANTAISDLKEVRRLIDREIGQIHDQKELGSIEEKLTKTTEQLEKAIEFKGTYKTDIATFEAQRDEILKELRSLEGSREIQIRRDEKQRDLKQLESEINQIRSEVIKWVGQKSLSIISRNLTKETLDFVDEASLKGRIPSPYNEEFVQGLINDENCICGRELKLGTNEWKAVAELLKNASKAELMGRVVRARSRISILKSEASEAPQILESLQAKLSNLVSKRDELEQVIAELGQRIQNLPLAEIVEKERAKKELDRKINSENQRLGEMNAGIRKLESERDYLERELEKVARTNKKARKLLSKKFMLEKAASFLEATLKQYENQARDEIEAQINNILAQVAHRDYKCKINSNFSIELTFEDGRSTPKSSGENQLLSLVFIASLVKYAASRVNKDDVILKPGTIAPLVLDSPFGQLDTNYQESTAEWIPQLAEQVVLLVSSSQGNERVLLALEQYIGTEYILISENAGRKDQKKQETTLAVRGKQYLTSLYLQPKNMTRIERII